MQLTYPRYIHSEFMTHRVFSRNASSSRAIPTAKLVETSLRDMVYPLMWGKNQAGMQASLEVLSPEDEDKANFIWNKMAVQCAEGVAELAALGVHKQWANRPLEWFGNITVVVTATDWDNFFELRNHEMAQPEIRNLARIMIEAMEGSIPEILQPGMWHLPYITAQENEELTADTLVKVSTARCARVSYLTQEGVSPTLGKDLELYDRLVGSVPLHASPCEHQGMAVPRESTVRSGNLRGWIQLRKLIESELCS